MGDEAEYQNLAIIGSGSFGRICKVRRISDGAILARKEISYRKMNEKERHQLVQEVNILSQLTHSNIVSYHTRHLDRENCMIYIFTEYCEGGDLADLIKRHKSQNQPIDELVIWSVLSQLLQALHECHHGAPQRNAAPGPILHRDIKPENVFLDSQGNAKLGDFGLSTTLSWSGAQKFARTFVGTPFYMSPELIKGSAYNTKSDIWALGCLTFELCNFAPPFTGADHRQLQASILAGLYPRIRSIYTRALCEMIARMLQVNPDRRPSAESLMQHQQLQYHVKIKRQNEFFSVKEQNLKEREAQIQQAENDIQNKIYGLLLQQKALEKLQLELRQREEAVKKAESLLERRESHFAKMASALEAEKKIFTRYQESNFQKDQPKLEIYSGDRIHQDQTTTTPETVQVTVSPSLPNPFLYYPMSQSAHVIHPRRRRQHFRRSVPHLPAPQIEQQQDESFINHSVSENEISVPDGPKFATHRDSSNSPTLEMFIEKNDAQDYALPSVSLYEEAPVIRLYNVASCSGISFLDASGSGSRRRRRFRKPKGKGERFLIPELEALQED